MKQIPLKKITPKQRTELALRRKVKAELIEKSGGKCQICGKYPKEFPWTLDLYHNHREGRKTSVEDCLVTCRRCHEKYPGGYMGGECGL